VKRKKMRRAMVAIMVLAIVSASIIVVGAQEESSWVCWRETIAVDTVGNAQFEASYGPFSMSDYNDLCAFYKPNPEVAIRFLRSRGAIYEFDNVETPVFDDVARSINYNYDILGWAKIDEAYIGDIWEIELPADAVKAAQYQNFLVFVWSDSETLTISTTILPESATAISFDPDEHVISYVLPSVTGTGTPRIDPEIKYKEEVMSAMYKVYGIQDLEFWLAKTVVKNTGTVPIQDLKVSYKITEYVPDWTTPETYAKVVPGQTIVDLYYPCLPSGVTELTTKRPLELLVRIQYTVGAKTYEEIVRKRFELLGINSFVWSYLGPEESTGSWYDYFDNVWGLPVFVTTNEVTLNRFAKEATSGIGACLSDEAAVRAMEACYNTICARGIGYITEPSGYWAGGTGSQYIQYPKDTLDRNAGTCIDLAILYCAMCGAVGLNSYLMLIPGHAFPVIETPSGMYLYPIEMTGVPNTEFANASETGLKEYDEAYRGDYYELDLRLLWDKGVTPPW